MRDEIYDGIDQIFDDLDALLAILRVRHQYWLMLKYHRIAARDRRIRNRNA